MLRHVTVHGRRPFRSSTLSKCKYFSSKSDDHWTEDRVAGYFGHNFPDFIEHWNRDTFRRVGYVLGASTGALAAGSLLAPMAAVPTVILGALTTAYWKIGLNDMKQTSHAIRRNYPVLGNMRYILETVRTGKTWQRCLSMQILFVQQSELKIWEYWILTVLVVKIPSFSYDQKLDNISSKMTWKESHLIGCEDPSYINVPKM